MRADVYNKSQFFQERMKNTFDRRVKEDEFPTQDLVLKWDARIEDKGKHGKFDHLWKALIKLHHIMEITLSYCRKSMEICSKEA